MKKFLKNPNGFTLVELMVVVAIIGILSAIAVPNFKKYQAKSKQSEAKIQLAAIYNSEVGALADYDTYASCLAQMGYEQTPRGYYVVGFVAGIDASQKFANCTNGGTTAAGADAAPTDKIVVPKLQLAVVTGNRPSAVTLGSVTQTTFVASAEGSIANPSVAANSVDKWTITETKAISNNIIGY